MTLSDNRDLISAPKESLRPKHQHQQEDHQSDELAIGGADQRAAQGFDHAEQQPRRESAQDAARPRQNHNDQRLEGPGDAHAWRHAVRDRDQRARHSRQR